jgi:hypothetical protein
MTDFRGKSSSIKFHQKSVSGRRAVPCRRTTDGHDAFRGVANTPNSEVTGIRKTSLRMDEKHRPENNNDMEGRDPKPFVC